MEKEAEKVAPRTLADINAEYRDLCANIGDREVKIAFLKSEIQRLQNRCYEIDQEAGALPKTAPAAPTGEANGNAAGPQ